MSMTKDQAGIPHKELAVSCFNNVWTLLEKPHRTSEENEQMVHVCHTSLWHWTQVPTHTNQNLSIGYWQLSRVYAVIGQGENALHYADLCLTYSEELDPFFIGCAHEAFSRSYLVLGQLENAEASKELAYTYAVEITDENSKQILLSDLESL
ncbi:hypothetical protein [Pontibacillus yanchengensis]|nr:hypothetical protein [Pontibacillus yanchengensis]